MTSKPFQLLEGCVGWPEEVARHHRELGHWIGRPLDSILRRSAEREGDRIAVVCGARRVGYGDLDRRVDRLASAFLDLGLRPLDRVVVQLPNALELVETLFALFRIGAIPVMALPGHRRSEIEYFCQHASAVAYVLADVVAGFDHRQLAREVREAAPTLRHLVVVGDAQELVSYASLDAPVRTLPAVDARQVALLQLSGGSTGTPKLIPRTHDDYFYSVRASVPLCGLDARSVYLVALPGAHNFTFSSAGILGALHAGARVVMCPQPHPDAAFPLLEHERVTITALVPPLASAWLSAKRARGSAFRDLRVLQIGGAKLGEELARDLVEGFGCTLQQVFGMAEGLVNYTRLGDPLERIVTTQGRPMSDDDEVRIVDDHDRDVPSGRAGHLLARGPYTIRGYYRAAAYDAIAFTADGFYRTGDLARLTADGDLVVEGRAKDQINRGGEKLAPVDLEQHIAAHPAVREAAVVGLPDGLLGERVCAVLVPLEGRVITRPELLAHLRERGVATWKLPDRVELVSALPRTSVGKIDKSELVRRFASQPIRSAS